jgi:hypothetical protein
MAMREGQSVASMVIAERFGPFAESQPELWTKRTFLLIVGKVYEHLVLRKKISPKEFLDLTRTLAENCKVDAKLQETSSTPKSGRSGYGPGQDLGEKNAVDKLEQIVRQLYGTNLQSGEALRSAPEQPSAGPM